MEPSRDDQLFANICNMVFILLDLGLEALERNHFTEKQSVGKFGSLSFGLPNSPRFVGEKRKRCKMFHVDRPLSPNVPQFTVEMAFLPKSPECMEFPQWGGAEEQCVVSPQCCSSRCEQNHPCVIGLIHW